MATPTTEDTGAIRTGCKGKQYPSTACLKFFKFQGLKVSNPQKRSQAREQRAKVLREVNQVQSPCTPESGYCRSAPKFTEVAARHWNLGDLNTKLMEKFKEENENIWLQLLDVCTFFCTGELRCERSFLLQMIWSALGDAVPGIV